MQEKVKKKMNNYRAIYPGHKSEGKLLGGKIIQKKNRPVLGIPHKSRIKKNP
jgi:hypothetical protein